MAKVDDTFCRPRDVAEILAVSVKTVYKLCDKGELTRLKVGRAVRISTKSLYAYIGRAALATAEATRPRQTAVPTPPERPRRRRGGAKGYRHVPPRR